MKYLLIVLTSLTLTACGQTPCSCEEQVKHTIDSLKDIYEELHSEEANIVAAKIQQATVAAPVPTQKEAKPKKEKVHTPTGDTYTDSKGKIYPIYVGAKGGKYIVRTSGKTGEDYNSYIK